MPNTDLIPYSPDAEIHMVNPAELTPDPACSLIPPMTPDAFESLVNSITLDGQREPILITPDRTIIDGLHRARACERIGENVMARIVNANADMARLISVEANIHRRQLTTSQRALAAARIVNTRRGTHAGRGDVSQEYAARMFTVSIRYIREAQRLIATGGSSPLIDEVWNGSRTLSSALLMLDAGRRLRRREGRVNIDPAPEQPSMPSATLVLSPGESGDILRALGPVLSGAIDGAAFAHYLSDVGIPAGQRAAILIALDEFADRAYDTFDEEEENTMPDAAINMQVVAHAAA